MTTGDGPWRRQEMDHKRRHETNREQLQESEYSEEYSSKSTDDEQEPATHRRRTQKNIAQQSASMYLFNGDEVVDGTTTIQDWFNEFDTLATVYQWSPQEKLVALVSNLKGAGLSHCVGSHTKLKRELISQFQPV